MPSTAHGAAQHSTEQHSTFQVQRVHMAEAATPTAWTQGSCRAGVTDMTLPDRKEAQLAGGDPTKSHPPYQQWCNRNSSPPPPPVACLYVRSA